jgi:hypothetical protein
LFVVVGGPDRGDLRGHRGRVRRGAEIGGFRGRGGFGVGRGFAGGEGPETADFRVLDGGHGPAGTFAVGGGVGAAGPGGCCCC